MHLCVCVSVCDIMCKYVCVIKIWKEGCREAGCINRWLLFVVKMVKERCLVAKPQETSDILPPHPTQQATAGHFLKDDGYWEFGKPPQKWSG